jgi:hypothetical protein
VGSTPTSPAKTLKKQSYQGFNRVGKKLTSFFVFRPLHSLVVVTVTFYRETVLRFLITGGLQLMPANTVVPRVKGSRKKITMDGDFPEFKPLHGFEREIDAKTGTTFGTISIKEFLKKQKEFMLTKKLEGLAQRTLKDYGSHFQYLNKWILQEYCQVDTKPTVTEKRYMEKGLFMAYTGYMISHFKPCTVNLRLRTLKCYLSWLHSEGMIKEDISAKLKLVKVPKDTIQPLLP